MYVLRCHAILRYIYLYLNKHSSSLLSYHASLLQNESRLARVFLGFCFSESLFMDFLSVESTFLGHSEIPNSADPCLQVCEVHPLGSQRPSVNCKWSQNWNTNFDDHGKLRLALRESIREIILTRRVIVMV